MAQPISVESRGFFGKIFLEPAPKPIIKDESFIKKQFKKYQPLIWIALYLLYFSSYLGRKQLAVGFQGVKSQGINGIEDFWPELKLGYADLLIIYNACYAIGKVIGGIIGDRANLKVVLPLSVGLSAVMPIGIVWAVNLYAAGSASLAMASTIMYIAWGLTGFIQAFSFPLCGKALTHWFSNKNRATVWSFWSTSHELGSAAATVVASVAIRFGGWQFVFVLPAIIAVIVAVFGLFALQEKPVTLGLPDVNTYAGCVPKEEVKKEEVEDNRTYGQAFVQEILKNKTIWILSLCFICVYIMRQGPVDWMIKAFENDPNVVSKTALVPLFGAIGTLSIPWVSKKLFDNRRAPTLFLYFGLSTICFLILRLVTPFNGNPAIVQLSNSAMNVTQWITLPLLGVATYGPLVMVGGVAAIESASKKVAATTTGIVGGVGYVGAIFISLFGKSALRAHNMGLVFTVMLIASVVAMISITLLWNQKANKDYAH